MLQSIAPLGSSLLPTVKQCARCSRKAGLLGSARRTHYRYRREFTTAVPERAHIDESPVYESRNMEAGPSTGRRNVWTKMQESPKRQCILTRKTLPADYLLKLKPRSYPCEDGLEGGTYLTPSAVNKCDPGRSFYLTLHREVIARIYEPGPHLGILAQNNLQIPRKLDEWIQSQLEERLIKELSLLVGALRKATLRFGTITTPDTDVRGIITRQPNMDENDVDQLLLHLPSPGSSPVDVPTKSSEIDLSALSPSYHSPLYKDLNHLLSTDRKYLLRQALANKTPISKELVGKRGSPNESLEGGIIALSSGSERGQLALPLMTALLRLKLYSGKGWTAQP